MAKLTFLGAVEGVTGSMFLLEHEHSSVLIDCGLFQGRKEEEEANFKPLPFNPQAIDAVILSHAHLDHSGRLPLLAREDFNAPIYMTFPTQDLIEVLLNDAASLQEKDVEWENKRRQRAGKPLIEPLYRQEDVDTVLQFCQGVEYYQTICIADGIELRFSDAGHILGSSIVEIWIDTGARRKKLVFSGDLGNSQAALLRDPDTIADADIVMIESTYGDREHRSMEQTLSEFEQVIIEASANGGNILIPSFAVGRTQEIIFRLGELYQQGKLKQQAVFLDSPMAIAVTEIYHRYQDVYNHEDRSAIAGHQFGNRARSSLHTFLPTLRYSTTTEESMALNRIASGAIIIAGSGMCNGGRIRHHLKHNLWRSNAHVIFVGYQAQGTPGRILIDGVSTFKVAGEKVAVKAQIHTLGGFSAHASQSQLLEWLEHIDKHNTRLFLVHGEEAAKVSLQQAANALGWRAQIPSIGETVQF